MNETKLNETVSDQDLIERVRQGERKAFKEFIDRYQVRVRNICYRFVNNLEDTEELSQDVFLEIYRSLDSFRGDSKVSTWIHRIAVNKSLDYVRKLKRKKRFGSIKQLLGLAQAESELISPENNNPDKIVESKERNMILWQAVESLPENQRVAITLTKYENCSYQEVAEVLDVSLSSVESLVYRAKGNLHKKLFDYYDKNL